MKIKSNKPTALYYALISALGICSPLVHAEDEFKFPNTDGYVILDMIKTNNSGSILAEQHSDSLILQDGEYEYNPSQSSWKPIIVSKANMILNHVNINLKDADEHIHFETNNKHPNPDMPIEEKYNKKFVINNSSITRNSHTRPLIELYAYNNTTATFESTNSHFDVGDEGTVLRLGPQSTKRNDGEVNNIIIHSTNDRMKGKNILEGITLDSFEANFKGSTLEATENVFSSDSVVKAKLNFDDVTINTPKGTAFYFPGPYSGYERQDNPEGYKPEDFIVDIRAKKTKIDADVLAVDSIIYGAEGKTSPEDGLSTPIANLHATENSELTGQTQGLKLFDLEKSKWHVKHDSTVLTLETNDSDIDFINEKDDAGNVIKKSSLTVEKDYAGGGRFHFDTELGKRTEVNTLVFKGDVNGTTEFILHNKNGGSIKASDGLELVVVEGKSSPNAFKLSQYFRQGLYQISHLDQCQFKKEGEDKQGWCIAVSLRPEAGIYAQNLEAANKLFGLRLENRIGDIYRYNPETTKGVWIRYGSGHNRQEMTDKENRTKGGRYVVQLGADLVNGAVGDYRYLLGIMGGYARQHANTTNSRSQAAANGSVKGYATGVYATWYQQNNDRTGPYVDAWLQYQWFKNKVQALDVNESYRSSGITFSLEAGYNFLLGKMASESGTEHRFYLQPQAQVTYLGVKQKRHVEENGTVVNGLGPDNVQGRLGLRAVWDYTTANQTNIQPFVEMNALHQNKRFGATMDGEEDKINNRSGLETKVGLDVNLNKNLKLWTSFTQQMGDKNYRDKQGLLGMTYHF